MATKTEYTTVLFITLLSLIINGIPVLGPDVVQAEIYKREGAGGRIHFSDSPIGEAEVVNEEVPPASEFLSWRRPPPEQTDPPNETAGTQDLQEDENTPSPAVQTTDQSAGEEVGIIRHGPFGKDGPKQTNWADSSANRKNSIKTLFRVPKGEISCRH